MADETATATPGTTERSSTERSSTERSSSSERPSGGGERTGGERSSGPGGGRSSAGRGDRPGGGSGGPGGRKFFRRKKVCKFCAEKIDAIPYRDTRLLQQFVAERGKIVPRRLTGVCTTHQRRLTRAIKQARNIALLPFAARF
jgi:small subunit ribosomal protein S18